MHNLTPGSVRTLREDKVNTMKMVDTILINSAVLPVDRRKYVDSYLVAKLFEHLRKNKLVTDTFISEVPVEYETLILDQVNAILNVTEDQVCLTSEYLETNAVVQSILKNTYLYIDGGKDNKDLEDDTEYCRRITNL